MTVPIQPAPPNTPIDGNFEETKNWVLNLIEGDFDTLGITEYDYQWDTDNQIITLILRGTK